MAYTVLARKYRSQMFDDIVGQEPIAHTLKNAIKIGRVAHAYLFAGTRGVGKTTMARVLAKALNCLAFETPTTDPCCKCDSCRAVNIGEDIDVIEIDGATNNGVEQVRELRQNAIYRPARSRFKIYIIDEVHMLTVQAFNALLKTLEEPPGHVKFIFATTQPNKVIATIQSRCQRFDFSNIPVPLIADQLRIILEQEKIQYEHDLILPIAKMANGSMRDALSLLDRIISAGAEPLTIGLLEQYLGCPNSEKVSQLLSAIGDSDAAATLSALDNLTTSGLSELQVVDSLTDSMRDLMVIVSTGADSDLLLLSPEQCKKAGDLAKKFDIAGLVYNITALEKLRWSIKNSDIPGRLLEASLLRLALSQHFLNVDDLISQLNARPGGRIKKNKPASDNAVLSADANPGSSTAHKQDNLPRTLDLETIRDKWQDFLRITAEKLGPSTSSLLESAGPNRFVAGNLTLMFPTSAQASKKILEKNGRQNDIESLLSSYYQVPIALAFEVANDDKTREDAKIKIPQEEGLTKARLISHPAVKTVLMGLDATITGTDQKV